MTESDSIGSIVGRLDSFSYGMHRRRDEQSRNHSPNFFRSQSTLRYLHTIGARRHRNVQPTIDKHGRIER
jgi:hypothetical protein